MSVVTQRPSTDRVIIRDVSWETYETLLKELESSTGVRGETIVAFCLAS